MGMPHHNAQGNLSVGLFCTFSVSKQRTNLLDHQPVVSGNCICFICQSNWSSTTQLHSDSGLNHHTTQHLSVQLFACYKDSDSLLSIDLSELPCTWNFNSLLSCGQCSTKPTCTHATSLALALLRAWNMWYSNVAVFLPHPAALIPHKPNPLPSAILFISSWSIK